MFAMPQRFAVILPNVLGCKVRAMDEDRVYHLQAAHRLRVALTDARMTQLQLAEATGVSHGTVSRHVNGKPITVGVLARYAKALGVSPSDLLPRLDSNQEPTGQGIAA